MTEQVETAQPTVADANSLHTKLLAFIAGLSPAEQELLKGGIERAVSANEDVQGYHWQQEWDWWSWSWKWVWVDDPPPAQPSYLGNFNGASIVSTNGSNLVGNSGGT